MKTIEERVRENPPQINIPQITKAVYAPIEEGSQHISNTFRLNYIKNLSDSKKSPNKRPSLHDPQAVFDFQSYSLAEIDHAYRIYDEALKQVKLNDKMLQRYVEKQARESKSIKDATVIEWMAKSSLMDNQKTAKQLSDPYFMALIKLIREFLKANYLDENEDLSGLIEEESDFEGLENESKLVCQEIDDAKNKLHLNVDRVNTILLLKTLVREFGHGLRALREVHAKMEVDPSDSPSMPVYRKSGLYDRDAYEQIARVSKESLLLKLQKWKELGLESTEHVI